MPVELSGTAAAITGFMCCGTYDFLYDNLAVSVPLAAIL